MRPMSNEDETPENRLRKELPDEVPVTSSERSAERVEPAERW